MTCSRCGSDNPAGKKFCGDCGAALGAQPARPAAQAEARKVVTIILADLIGATSLTNPGGARFWSVAPILTIGPLPPIPLFTSCSVFSS
jgi:hypothetical protein